MDPSILALTQAASLRGAGLVLDEVAVNTSMLQVLEQKRRLPAVLKVMTGSFSIKMAVIPMMLAINAFLPGAILPLLTFGGLHLASEGLKHLMEKIKEKKKAKEQAKTPEKKDAAPAPATPADAKKLETRTIKKVLVIDGLLSIEIAVMTLPIIAGVAPLMAAGALALTGAIRTAWMYSIIGGVLSMPRMGDWLEKRQGDNPVAKAARALGKGMHKAQPYIVKGFSIAGTAALLMIGGGLVLHGIPGAEHLIETAVHAIGGGGIANWVLTHAAEGVFGIIAGAIAHKPLDILYHSIGKGVKALAKPVIDFVKKHKKKPANDNPAPAPAVERTEPASAPALSTVPDPKAALNAAAAKAPEAVAPAPEQNNAPAPPVQPEQPKAPPKVNP